MNPQPELSTSNAQAEKPTTMMKMTKLLKKIARKRFEQDKKLVDLKWKDRAFDNKKYYVVHNWSYSSFNTITPFEDGYIDGLERAIPTHGFKFEHRSAFEEREAATNQSVSNQ